MNHPAPHPPHAQLHDEDGVTVIEISGDWLRGEATPQWNAPSDGPRPSGFRSDHLGRFDSTLPAFLLARLRELGDGNSPDMAPLSLDGLPDELKGLMELALAVPEEADAGQAAAAPSDLKRLGKATLKVTDAIHALNVFVGDTILAFGRLFTGKAHFRSRDFWQIVQESGAQALPIVSLISFLIGMILAFVGNVQLSNFGASIYMADLVAIAMLREMGVMMTAIIISGRTGAAFAATLGSMKANQEIDALRTFGFAPFDFLVLPRILALVLMMPILTIYADVVGILGGMLVGMAVDIPATLYWNQTLSSLTLTTASLGVFKSVFFGIAIAICGCMQGMKAESSSAGVGAATTRAVVASITTVIILDSAFAAIFTVLGI